MRTSGSETASQAVTLIAGLVAVVGLMYGSLLAMTGGWGLSLLVGAVEMVLAWRVEPPETARVLRLIAGLFGAVTVAYSILRLFEPALT